MNWNDIVNKVTPYVVKIETPSGHGTGFLCLYGNEGAYCGFATANHVVAHADAWQEPLRIHHHHSGKTAFLREGERIIYTDTLKDSAVVLFDATKLDLPKLLVQLRPIEDRLPIGSEVGWLGYPAVTHTLCFFSGNISAFQEWRHAYLIDGVAISGVSGGPVLYSHPTEGVQIVGSISAYMANRATGEALPGLSVAQDLSHFHAVALNIQSLDEANRQKRERAAAVPLSEPEAPASQVEPERSN
jgi:hypothetical protein